MSESVWYAVISAAEKRFYFDHWGAPTLLRELVWGPNAMCEWLVADAEIESLDVDADAGVVIDLDAKRLIWNDSTASLYVPKVRATYLRLVGEAWPGFTLEHTGTDWLSLMKAVDEPYELDSKPDLEHRSTTVAEADPDSPDRESYDWDESQKRLGVSEPEDEGDEKDEGNEYQDDGEEDEDSDNSYAAWVTIIDASGSVRHHLLIDLPCDLILANPTAISELTALSPADIPPEIELFEGMWIDIGKKQIGLWGGPDMHRLLDLVQLAWNGWTVGWSEDGYRDQCAASGPSGLPLSVAESLGRVVPTILSTGKLDASTVVGKIGNEVKRTAVRLTGCFVFVICSPVVLFSLISGNWKAGGLTIAIVIILTTILFKLAEAKIRRRINGLRSTLTGDQAVSKKSSSAGPLAPETRREVLNQTLIRAGLPPLAEIEAFLVPDPELEGFLE